MGKVAATEMKRRKKGRPPKNSPSLSTPQKLVNYDSTHPTTSRRSTDRNPNHLNSPQQEFIDDDDDDERKEKKVKLVVRLPQSEDSHMIDNQKQQQKKNKRHFRDDDSASGSGSDSGPESEDRVARAKRRKINAVDHGSDSAAAIQEKRAVKGTDTPIHGLPLEFGPTTALPDKKLLVFILDRLQKKDTHGVFSEPVDINELPDYFELIEQPMDFGTLRKKLDGGVYKNLEELEADVFLICSNAMQYNSPNTVYYRQARSIEEIAKRDFENLRHEGDNGEPQPRVVRRGRPPGNKNQKKLLETSLRVDHELSPSAALPSGEDKATGSNSYNLRKAPALNRYRSSDVFVSSYGSRNGVNYSEWLADWNDEFPANILRADMKYGKKQFTVDENRRETYRQFHPPSSAHNSPALCNSIGDAKRLVPVGLHDPLAYARSIARFAANLGPIAWEVASRRIETALPGIPYGPGWVGESGPQPPSFSNSSAGDFCNPNNPVVVRSNSDLNSGLAPSEGTMVVEAVRKPSIGSSELVLQGGSVASYMKTPFPSVQQKQPIYHQPRVNGFDATFGYNSSKIVLRKDDSSSHFSGMSWNMLRPGYQITKEMHNTVLGPPDLNVRIPAASPSSSLQIGSPRQPDLALQL
ncbi:hypothetical protein OROGR_033033 [Orobanche gracilis]